MFWSKSYIPPKVCDLFCIHITREYFLSATYGETLLRNGGLRHEYVKQDWRLIAEDFREEEAVLDILNRHADGNIRVLSSGHAWSDLIKSGDVIIDLRSMNRVDIEKNGSDIIVNVQGGCVLQDLLDTIHAQTDHTMPSLGGIKKQTIAGVVSTGTHGSGKHSLSHYMDSLRIAAYDSATGKAKIYEWKEGQELKAARCSLGCMGVILSVTFHAVPKYWLQENITQYDTIDEVLEKEKEFPLQQFTLFPYCWKYFIFEWQELDGKPEGIPNLKTHFQRIYDFIAVDVLAHATLKVVLFFASSQKGSSQLIRVFYGKIMPMSMGHKRNVIDESEHTITLAHYLFQHLEMEVFIPAHNIQKATTMIRHLVSLFAGQTGEVPEHIRAELATINKTDILESHKGLYTHHYPLFFRRILPDDTLISMTAQAQEDYYSISFFTYLSPDTREHFFEFAETMARVLTELYDAKLHWGKYFPLEYKDVKHLYPHIEEFHRICSQVDPKGVFRNEYTSHVLGFSTAHTANPKATDYEK